jgi:hypothetical protein
MDGVLIGSKEIGPGSVDNEYEFRIGANASGPIENKYFNGILDDVKLFNKALSASEVADLYYGPGASFGLQGGNESNNGTDLLSGTIERGIVENSLSLFPNPFSESTSVQFKINVTGHASVTVYNSVGQEIETLFDGLVTRGEEYLLNFSSNSQPKGFYYLILDYEGNGRMVKKMFITD